MGALMRFVTKTGQERFLDCDCIHDISPCDEPGSVQVFYASGSAYCAIVIPGTVAGIAARVNRWKTGGKDEE